jgi:hypothetical protein
MSVTILFHWPQKLQGAVVYREELPSTQATAFNRKGHKERPQGTQRHLVTCFAALMPFFASFANSFAPFAVKGF